MSKRAFTILELLVAMALMVILLAISAVVFKTSVQAQQAASATAEIMQKYQALTHQLKTDLAGLRKDAEICIIWRPGIDTNNDNIVDDYTRMDRMYFFTAGSFQTYNTWPIQGVTQPQVLQSSIARVCYMLAGAGNGNQAASQKVNKRNLGRSQHIYTAANVIDNYIPPSPQTNPNYGNLCTFPDWASFTSHKNNFYEYDKKTLAQWRDDPAWLPLAVSEKSDMVERILDADLFAPFGPRGIQINPAKSLNLHMLLAQGVGQFKIQGWLDSEKRWYPEVDPNGDGNFSDTDFFPNGSGISASVVPDLLYPYKRYYMYKYTYNLADLDQDHFNEIPGLGPALKFTFTLYDSRGVFREGKTFTYIVYLNP
jgi:prepilin-type N-terminal cleavage/methylation domain-containing protein